MQRKTKRETGQALILVLILLGVGAVIIVPFLHATDTVLKGRQIYGQAIKEDYAADAAVEYGMWRLKYEPEFSESLPIGEESDAFYVTLNGVTANATVTAQTLEFELSGQQLAGRAADEIYFRVEKEVSVSSAYSSLATDGFEGTGYTCSDGNDGTGYWNDDWDLGGNYLITSSGEHEGECCLRLRGDDNSTPGDGHAEREADLSSTTGDGPYLEFWVRIDSFEYSDIAYCKVSTDGENWDTLKTFTSADNGDYEPYLYDLSGYGTPPSFYISFETNLSTDQDYMYIDDISFTTIEETETVEPGVDTFFTYSVNIKCLDPDGCHLDSIWDELPEQGPSSNYLRYVTGSTDWDVVQYQSFAIDGFETSGDTGPWIADWNLSGSAYETTDGEYAGDRCLRLDGERYATDGYAKRAINLSSYSGEGPYLYFWARAWLWYGDSLKIKVSTDGTNWDTLENLDVQDGDDQYHQYWYDLSGYGYPSVLWVAFEMNATSYYADNCRFRVDNIEFSNSQSPEAGEWPVPPFEPTGITTVDSGSERYQRLEWDFETAGYNDISFDYGEERYFSFQAHQALSEGTYCNRIYVTDGDSTWWESEGEPSIINSATAKIVVGDPDETNCSDGMLSVNKVADPEIVYPYELSTVTYTITIENVDSSPVTIYAIEDWLPATGSTSRDEGFTYVDDSATGRIIGRSSSPVLFYDGFNRNDSNTVWCWTESESNSSNCQIDDEVVESQIDGIITQSGISTANCSNITFSYRWTGRYACESTDKLYADWKPSSSGTWTNVGNHSLNTETWYNQQWNLPSTAANTTIDIRFRVVSNNGDEEARIDNVRMASGTVLNYTPVCMPDDNEGTDFFTEEWSEDYYWYQDYTGQYRWFITWDFSYYPESGDSVWDRCEGGGADGPCYLFPYNDYSPTLTLQPGEILEIIFQAEGTLTYSGTYLNEVFVKISEGGYWDEDDEWLYSWPTGTVIVPQYDLKAETLHTVLRANALLSPLGAWWRSWYWWWRW